MTLPFSITVAASGAEGLIWLAVIFIWLIFQGLSSAARKKLPPPPGDGSPTQRELPQRPAQPPRDELRDMIESLTGQKPPLYAPDNEAEEALAPRRPAPRPPPIRKAAVPPSRFSQPARKMTRPVQSAVSTSAPRVAKPPPMPPAPESAPLPAAPAPLVFAQASRAREALRLAPLMKMTWPRSHFQRFAIASHRTAAPSPLKRQLTGRAALRHAMVSRIVLGPPGGR
jgi:hypothetical protein